jgi:hypothetical protein
MKNREPLAYARARAGKPQQTYSWADFVASKPPPAGSTRDPCAHQCVTVEGQRTAIDRSYRRANKASTGDALTASCW